MSVVTVRPTGTAASANISVVGAASAHAALNDNSDSSYVTGTGYQANAVLDVGTTTLGASQRCRRARINIRNARDATVSSQPAQVSFLDPVNTSPSAGKWSSARNLTSILTGTGPWANAAPGGVAWSQAVLDRIRVWLIWFGSSTGAGFQRDHELYVDFDVNDRPAVTAPAVSGATTSTRPTWTTVYSDADSDLQTAWQAKVYSAAQYGASNFSPDTSVATWDSGQVAGADTAGTIGTDLVSGTTYRLYVRAAQDWPGPEGVLWWSAWQFTGFTVSVTPPAAPSLVLSTLTAAPASRVLADATAPVNLLTADNSTFEGSLGQWVALSNCTIIQSGTNPADGSFAMQMSSTAGGDMTARSGNEPFFGQHVKGGVTYTALASFRAAVSARSVAVGFRWQDGAGAAIGADVYGSTVTDGTGGYIQAVATAAAPANAKSAQVLVKVVATGAGAEIHRVDKVDLHAGSSTTWTSGGLSSQAVAVERGERVDTSRGAQDNWAHPDVAAAGSVRQTAGYGFGIVGGSNDVLGWEFLDKDIAGGGPNGMLHWQPRSASNASLNAGTWAYGGPGSEEWRFPVVVGSAHVFSCWAWVGSGTLPVTQRIDWIADDMQTIVSTSSASPVTLTTTPQQLVFSATCPATASGAQGTVSNHTSDATADIYVTRFGWGLGTAAVDDRPAAGGPLEWTPVRALTAVNLVGFPFGYDTGQRAVIGDWEAPAGRPLLYRAQLAGSLAGNPLASAYSPYATVLLVAPARTVIRDPLAPYASVLGNIDVGDTGTRSSDAAIVHPLGRDADPVLVTAWRSGLDTGLAIVALSDAELSAFTRLLDAANSLLVLWIEGGRTYYTVTGWQSQRLGQGRHTISVAAVETAAP